MRICDFLELCIEPGLCTVAIYDVEKDKDLWKGTAEEIPSEFAELEVDSWDVPMEPGIMTFNVSK